MTARLYLTAEAWALEEPCCELRGFNVAQGGALEAWLKDDRLVTLAPNAWFMVEEDPGTPTDVSLPHG